LGPSPAARHVQDRSRVLRLLGLGSRLSDCITGVPARWRARFRVRSSGTNSSCMGGHLGGVGVHASEPSQRLRQAHPYDAGNPSPCSRRGRGRPRVGRPHAPPDPVMMANCSGRAATGVAVGGVRTGCGGRRLVWVVLEGRPSSFWGSGWVVAGIDRATLPL